MSKFEFQGKAYKIRDIEKALAAEVVGLPGGGGYVYLEWKGNPPRVYEVVSCNDPSQSEVSAAYIAQSA